MGASLDIQKPLIDTDSKLSGITEQAQGDYINKLDAPPELTNLTDGNFYQEYTRLINPALNIKGLRL